MKSSNYFLVIYEDGLQGKTHKKVFEANTEAEAWDKCLQAEAWQSPRILDVLPYKHANRIPN